MWSYSTNRCAILCRIRNESSVRSYWDNVSGLARDGFQVVGVDIDTEKVQAIQSGQPTVLEPGLAAVIADGVRQCRLIATHAVEEAVRASDLALITVGTPSREDGGVSSEAVERVVQSIGKALRGQQRSYSVCIRSTLLPGILEDRLAPLLAEAAGRMLGADLCLCNNPEFLREGSAIRDYDDPPFVIVGAASPEQAEAVLALYRKIDAEKIVTDTRTAALVKYACNGFHALKVSFANEMGALSKSFGANGHEVMSLVCRDRKLNISTAYLRPGLAFGGSCLPKDLRAVVRHAEQSAVRLELLPAILAANEAQLNRAIKLVQSTGHRKLGIVGLSFKAGTDDLRESPMVLLCETLLGRGFDLKIYDPHIGVSRLRGRNLTYVERHLPHLAALLVEHTDELCAHASLLVYGTDVANALQLPATFVGDTIDLRCDLGSVRTTGPASQGEPNGFVANVT